VIPNTLILLKSTQFLNSLQYHAISCVLLLQKLDVLIPSTINCSIVEYCLFFVCFFVGNTEDQLSSELKLTSFLSQPTLLHVISDSKSRPPVNGVSVLGSQLFVARSYVKSLDVYNTISFTLTRKLKIPGSKYLESIVACQHNNCLYISDTRQKILYRRRFDRTENVRSNWSINERCGGLSVTRSYSVLVTLVDVRRVQEYTTDGSLMRDIRLENSIEDPLHCIQLSSDRFVVSHGNMSTDQSRVCIIDTNGHIVQSYGEHRGSGIGQMRKPSNTVVDKHGHVMVVDEYNNRVELLSPTLTHLGYMQIPGYELDCLRALHFDELNHRLYIGGSRGRIFVLTADRPIS